MTVTMDLSGFEKAALAALLGHCYGNGVVFVRSRDDRKLLKKAVCLGLVDDAGAITDSGVSFRAEWAAQWPLQHSR